jgi:hypothetical protein
LVGKKVSSAYAVMPENFGSSGSRATVILKGPTGFKRPNGFGGDSCWGATAYESQLRVLVVQKRIGGSIDAS